MLTTPQKDLANMCLCLDADIHVYDLWNSTMHETIFAPERYNEQQDNSRVLYNKSIAL